MRINIINPSLLTDQHLIAEYREIKMLPKALVRSINSKNGFNHNDIPESYTLNKGHGKYFYDKLDYIEYRFQLILNECSKRGFKTDFKSLYDTEYDYSSISSNNYNQLFRTLETSYDEILINVQRIIKRVYDSEPNFYKYYSKNISFLELVILYTEELNIGLQDMWRLIRDIEGGVNYDS